MWGDGPQFSRAALDTPGGITDGRCGGRAERSDGAPGDDGGRVRKPGREHGRHQNSIRTGTSGLRRGFGSFGRSASRADLQFAGRALIAMASESRLGALLGALTFQTMSVQNARLSWPCAKEGEIRCLPLALPLTAQSCPSLWSWYSHAMSSVGSSKSMPPDR